MIEKATGGSYSGAAKALHWLIVVLLIAQFIFAWTMPHIGRNTPVTTLISLHFTVGIVILAVAVIRLIVRLMHGEPEPDRRLAALADHVGARDALAALCAAVRGPDPRLDERLLARHADRDVRARIAESDREAGAGWGWTGDVHSLLAEYGMLTLVGLHVAAGLYHYFVRRDRVLQRMLPGT